MPARLYRIQMCVCLCVCPNTDCWQHRDLGPALLQIEARMWPIFYFCTTSMGHITVWWKYVKDEYMCAVLWCNVWVMNVRSRWVTVKPVAGISLLLSKSAKGSARFNVPIRRTNRYQQYIRLHIKCTAEGDLIQVYLEHKLANEVPHHHPP